MLKSKCFIYRSIIYIFFLGALWHFIYDLLGEILLFGLISPVNESIWEHIKIAFFPTVIVWVAGFFLHKNIIDKNKWFSGMLSSALFSSLSIPSLFYFYTGAFGIASLYIDIFNFFLSTVIGQLVGGHIYTHSKGVSYKISILILIIIAVIFMIFTLYPPHLPLFMDSVGKFYGIK